MNSFQIIRTNPILTTNLKINVDSNMNLYLDTIKSNSSLSNFKYSKYRISKESFLEIQIPLFYDGLPKEHAYFVKNRNDNNVVYKDYSNQFDDIYYAGANYITDNSYNEEFEYFAPLYIRKNNIPDGFVILRVDDAGIYNKNVGLYELGNLNKDNFRYEIINKWKCVDYFDMTNNSNFGYWLDENINQNERFPVNSFLFDAKKLSQSRWFGIDYNAGVYTNKSLYLDDLLSYDQPHFRFEEKITNGFKDNSLIYPHILNFNFLFNDNPATPERFKKYTFNRYYGFYVDKLEFVTNLTSYITPKLKENVSLFNNIIISGETGSTWDICDINLIDINSVNPFLDDKWDDNKNYYIYVKDDLYQLKRFKDEKNDIWIYKLISDEILDEYWNISNLYNKTIEIKYDGNEDFSYLSPNQNVINFKIDPYIECLSGKTDDMYNDLYLIKINDKFHVLKKLLIENQELFDNDPKYKYVIQSDWGIISDKDKLRYWIGGDNSEYYEEYDIENINRKPLVYSIYKVKFLDIKDFDFDRLNTKYSNFDYEKSDYYETKEDKLYVNDYNSDVYPLDLKRNSYSNKDQGKLTIVSSEYISSEELYETKQNGDISNIWVKNQSICKWGFLGSVSQSDYPYKLNNSKVVGGYFNRDVDVFSTIPNIYNKNLDYFYRVGNLIDKENDEILYYLNQTSNIQTEFLNPVVNDIGLNGGDSFNIAVYFEKNVPNNFNFDYFDYFFSNFMYVENNGILYKNRYRKYSTFYSDINVYPETIFKGLKIRLNEIVDINRNNQGKISKIITNNTGKYDGYKISIIFNDVYRDRTSITGVKFLVNSLNNYRGIINVSGSGIHVIINDIYKNILVIINVNILNLSLNRFNDVDIFGEKDGVYTGQNKDGVKEMGNYNPDILTASNFINAVNDLNEKHGFDNFITFYHIYKNSDGFTEYKKSLINGVNNPIKPPLTITIIKPDSINVKNNSYNVELIKGPSINPLYNKDNFDKKIIDEKEYLSRKLVKNFNKDKSDVIYRYSGSYEPIFNDLNIFNQSLFCIINPEIVTFEEIVELETNKSHNGFNFTPIPDNKSWKTWNSINNICEGDTIGNYVHLTVPGNVTGDTSNYLVLNNFNFNIPLDSVVKGIELRIERKSNYDDSVSNVKDEEIILSKKFDSTFDYSDNKADTISTWGNTFSGVTYGSNVDLWDNDWLSIDINSPDFCVLIKTRVKNELTETRTLANIKCVDLTVYYEFDMSYISGTTLYYNKNIKFDETTYNFGETNEIIYSKVNQDNNILKFGNAKYPMVDQFGYSTTNDFVFKSDWDTQYYNKTLDSFED